MQRQRDRAPRYTSGRHSHLVEHALYGHIRHPRNMAQLRFTNDEGRQHHGLPRGDSRTANKNISRVFTKEGNTTGELDLFFVSTVQLFRTPAVTTPRRDHKYPSYGRKSGDDTCDDLSSSHSLL